MQTAVWMSGTGWGFKQLIKLIYKVLESYSKMQDKIVRWGLALQQKDPIFGVLYLLRRKKEVQL